MVTVPLAEGTTSKLADVPVLEKFSTTPLVTSRSSAPKATIRSAKLSCGAKLIETPNVPPTGEVALLENVPTGAVLFTVTRSLPYSAVMSVSGFPEISSMS